MTSRRALALLVGLLGAPGDAPPPLRLGATITGAVEAQDPVVETEALAAAGATDPARGPVHPLTVAADGVHTIDLVAHLHDAYLVLRDDAGAVLAEDDDDGIGTHARLVVELEAGRRYRVQAGALRDGAGPYELTLSKGAPRARTRDELAEATVADARRRVQVTSEVRGVRSAEMPEALHALASALYGLGRFAEAEKVWELALAAQEEVAGPDDPQVAELLINLAAVAKRQQHLDGVRELLDRALAIQETALGPDHLRVSTTLNHLADLGLRRAELDAARRHAERALAIRRAALGDDHGDVATTLDLLARIVGAQGDVRAAVTALEHALRIREGALGPKHPLVAVTLSNLADASRTTGDLRAARRLQERALAIREELLPPDHPDLGTALNNLAVVLRYTGEYDRARASFERALAIREGAFGPRSPLVASTLNNLAMLLRDQGDTGGARALFERSLAITEETRGGNHPEVAATLNNYASALWEEDDVAGARAAYERSLAIAESVLGADHPHTATTLSNLATLLGEVGEHERARELSERALAIHERAWGSRHVEVALDLLKLGDIARRGGETARAIELYDRSHEMQRALYGAHHPYSIMTRTRSALARAQDGDAAGAWRLVRAANAERRGHLEQSLSRLTEGEGFLYLARIRAQLHLELTLAHRIDEPGAVRQAYETLIDGKGRVGRLLVRSRERVLDGMDDATAEVLAELRDVQSRLSSLALEGAGDGSELEALRERRAELDRRLRRAAATSSLQATDFEGLRSVLPAGAALVDLFAHPFFVPEGHAAAERRGMVGVWTEPRLTAWITRPALEAPAWVDLGPVAAVAEACEAHLADLARPEAARDASNDALRRLLWEPLTPHLDGADRIFVSPDGVVATVPFETLRTDDGRYLVEIRALVYAGDADTRARLAREPPPPSGPARALLVIGGVDYDRRAGLAEEGGARVLAAATTDATPTARKTGRYHGRLRGGFSTTWPPLPTTASESRAVSDLHEATARPDARRLLLQGGAATEPRLAEELPRHDVIHLATHGFFQPEGFVSLWDSATSLADVEAARNVVGMHPGLLSGLVCAGANLEAPDDGDDGYLTAEELGWLDLSGADLVVLSACETGLGKAQAGEGLLGLRRAFRAAGATTVISSLWSVDDRSTATLMRSFYGKLWREGRGRHEALRQAQLEMLRDARTELGEGRPDRWGAFVLDGEWR